jgi:predicted ATPase
VTSRAALRVRCEHEVVVAPLALPQTGPTDDLDALARVPSVALFVERARTVHSDFELTAVTAGPVADICRRLDGLPLALELAAARTRLLTVQDLASRLDPRLPVLSRGPRDAPSRQQTLRASIDWSYDLLSKRDQRLFRRLSVFAAGARLELAEQVCGDRDTDHEDQVLDGLADLVDQNLVRRDTQSDGAARLRLLDTIREYAVGQLEASGEAEAIQRRHALAFVAVAESAAPELAGARRTKTVQRLAADFDNLRNALAWLIQHGHADLSCRLTGALVWWWYPLGQVCWPHQYSENAGDAGCPRASRLACLKRPAAAGKQRQV